MAAIASIYLDVRVSKRGSQENETIKGKDKNLYPVKIKITFNRERRYYGLDAKKVNDMLKSGQTEKFVYKGLGNYSILSDVFKKATGENPKQVYRELHDVFLKLEAEYQEKADRIKPFSFDDFSAEFDKHKPENNVFSMMDRKIKQLEEEDRIGSAVTYRCSLNSLKEFTGKNAVPFEYFTESSLKRYEQWMKGVVKEGDKKKSTSTIGIYLRSLRAVFNEAIKTGITDHYPFGKGGFTIQNGKGRKIAIDTNELKLIFDYVIQNDDAAAFYMDVWKLTYLLNGINIKDLVLLKKGNIVGEFICYFREKTKNTAKEKAEIKIYFSEEARQIIEKWGNVGGNKYLLPLLDGKETEKEIKQKVSNLVRAINHAIKIVAGKLEIKKNITCYTARHSWATQMMRHGAPVSFIGKQLGHMNSSSTDNYLNSFEEDTIKEWQKKLTEFKV